MEPHEVKDAHGDVLQFRNPILYHDIFVSLLVTV